MARGTINNRNTNLSDVSHSPSGHFHDSRVMHNDPNRSLSRGFSRASAKHDPFNTSKNDSRIMSPSRMMEKNLAKIHGIAPTRNFKTNQVQSVVGPNMSPGMRRLRNNSHAAKAYDRDDSRSSYSRDPFSKNLSSGMKYDYRNKWQNHNNQHAQGYQSPSYTHSSNWRPNSRPNNQKFY